MGGHGEDGGQCDGGGERGQYPQHHQRAVRTRHQHREVGEAEERQGGGEKAAPGEPGGDDGGDRGDRRADDGEDGDELSGRGLADRQLAGEGGQYAGDHEVVGLEREGAEGEGAEPAGGETPP